MPTYVTLSNFTDHGMKNIKDTLKRTEAFKKATKEAGIQRERNPLDARPI